MLKVENKKSKNFGEEYEQVEGYWTSLKAAWQAAVEVFALNADSNEELKAVLNQMESLKGALKWKPIFFFWRLW